MAGWRLGPRIAGFRPRVGDSGPGWPVSGGGLATRLPGGGLGPRVGDLGPGLTVSGGGLVTQPAGWRFRKEENAGDSIIHGSIAVGRIVSRNDDPSSR